MDLGRETGLLGTLRFLERSLLIFTGAVFVGVCGHYRLRRFWRENDIGAGRFASVRVRCDSRFRERRE